MNEPNDWGLPAASLEAVRRILQAEPAVQRAILFGSRAKGTHKPGSDIDLALEGQGLTLDVISRLASAFDESMLLYLVDLCWLEAVDQPALRDHIARMGHIVYERAPVPAGGENEGMPCAD